MGGETSNAPGAEAHVPDFSVAGFGGSASNPLAEAHARLGDLRALQLSACVGASYDAATNQICFTIPHYGRVCVTSPVAIPISADLKACVQTCGSLIPTGVKATIYLDGIPVFSRTVIGFC